MADNDGVIDATDEYKLLLKQWGLEKFISRFEDEGITDESFYLLDEETVQTIFDKKGPLLIFRKRYRDLHNTIDRQSDTSSNTSSFSTITYASSGNSVEGEYPYYSVDDSIVLQLDDNQAKYTDKPVVIASSESTDTDVEASLASLFKVPEVPELNKECSLPGPSSTGKRSHIDEDIAQSCSNPMSKKVKLSEDSLFPNGLEKFLEKQPEGCLILGSKKKLNNYLRQKLAKIVVNYMVAQNLPKSDYTVKAETFSKVAKEIVQVFPSETEETYYIPFLAKKAGAGLRQPARGKLWSRYINVRAALRNANAAMKTTSLPEKEPLLESPELKFLKCATEPIVKVIHAWEETFHLRQQFDKEATLEDIYNTYPALKTETGLDLLESDFNRKYEDKCDVIYNEWPKVASAIIKEAAERGINIFQDPSNIGNIILQALFFPFKIVIYVTSPDTALLDKTKTAEDLDSNLLKRKVKLDLYNLPMQPVGVGIGDIEKGIEYFYLVINQIKYKVNSSIRCLELLYKAIHALNLEYPPECQQIWLVVQELIFKMGGKRNSAASGKSTSDQGIDILNNITTKHSEVIDEIVEEACSLDHEKLSKKFFELPNVYATCLTNLKDLQSKMSLSSIIQKDFWLEKANKIGDGNTVFPFYIYFDEFESGNPLGSHAGIHKIGAIYCSTPVIPEEQLYERIVQECTFLETNGITINLPEKSIKIYFCLTLIVGDNLGLNSILGFTECFRANYFCRFCRCHRDVTQKLVEQENDSLIRTKTSYDRDVAINNITQTGIKESSIWNEIPSFHPMIFFEGIALFDMTEILHHFVFVDSLFTIETLNCRLEYFNFGKQSINKPPLISYSNLKNKSINMSCAEMKTFVHYAGLMFGDLIPVGNRVWKIYIILRKILDILFLDNVSEHDCILLKKYVAEHHTLYQELFKLPLKPKHHNVVHYPWIMDKVGPLKNMSTLRYESKHREFKKAANAVSSRVNITHTLALKNQLKLCLRFIAHSGFKYSINASNTSKSILQDIKIKRDEVKAIYHIKSMLLRNMWKDAQIVSKGVFSKLKIDLSEGIFRICCQFGFRLITLFVVCIAGILCLLYVTAVIAAEYMICAVGCNIAGNEFVYCGYNLGSVRLEDQSRDRIS
ncbi:hypothetical protein NQ315_014971 [Exocentrus adspersus]|uniref:SAM domain-containing protein n=1 Tax=Exocentrus adspersus TaxID=1586481 RepID=A0AAV8V5A5_9CUCU|nr:hypothetical protein NQ315_014971 [Exocentrus adspersus]